MTQFGLLSGFSVHRRVEIFEDLPEVEAVFVAVGGGGLIGGIATYLKSVKPSVKVNRDRKCWITLSIYMYVRDSELHIFLLDIFQHTSGGF